ncbi:MAG: LrgB family protein [Fusobacteriota bacterium]
MFENMFNSQAFGILITILMYKIAMIINKKTKISVLNPVIVSGGFIIGILLMLDVDYETYNNGGKLISFFLEPATVILAIPLYKNIHHLKRYSKEIVFGITIGSFSSIISVFLLSKIFGMDFQVILSLLPKSITTPIGLEVSKNIGGLRGITVIAIVLTGIFGATFMPLMTRIFGFKNKIAIGVATGTSSHALGTSRAIEVGEVEGAMSGLAIGIAGLVTTLIIPLMLIFIK